MKKIKKLVLNKDFISNLNPSEMGNLNGGGNSDGILFCIPDTATCESKVMNTCDPTKAPPCLSAYWC